MSSCPSTAEVLGKGVLGTTYRATLDGGEPVLTTKRLREVHLPDREFRDRVVALSALRHDNLPALRAYFYSKEEKLLVYDFVGAGSLSSLLHGDGSEGSARLDFTARARSALVAAHGVAFIHGGGAKSAHGNIKSSNVVVTGTRDGAYVAHYGLAQLIGVVALPRRGTRYSTPEVTDARHVSQKADVYSYGVVLLLLLFPSLPLVSSLCLIELLSAAAYRILQQGQKEFRQNEANWIRLVMNCCTQLWVGLNP